MVFQAEGIKYRMPSYQRFVLFGMSGVSFQGYHHKLFETGHSTAWCILDCYSVHIEAGRDTVMELQA